ncbi:2Fe-2S iron-sulfur cluster-binding protein [Alloalcanivorax gelatiniphagus]
MNMQITVIDRQNQSHELVVEPGTRSNLMMMMVDAGLPVRAECGGSCVCATCHVYVRQAPAGALSELGEDEEDALDLAFEPGPDSRLACQIPITDACDGLKVELAPEWP